MKRTGPATVEVAIPTWNRAATVTAAVESALRQDIPLVVSVFDNGSSDDTLDRLKAIEDDRLVIHRWDENRGRFANFNRALQSGSTEFLLLLFDDEILLPGALESLLEAAEADTSLAFVHGHQVIRHTSGKTLFTGLYGGVTPPPRLDGLDFIRLSFRSCNYVWINCALFRRSMIAGDELDPRDTPLDDVAFMLRAATRGAVRYVPQAIATRTDGNAGEAMREGLLVAGPDGGHDVFSLEGSILMQRAFERFLLRNAQGFSPHERVRMLNQIRRGCAWSLGLAAAERVRKQPLRALTAQDPQLSEITAWTSGWTAKLQLVRSTIFHWKRLKSIVSRPPD